MAIKKFHRSWDLSVFYFWWHNALTHQEENLLIASTNRFSRVVEGSSTKLMFPAGKRRSAP